MYFFYVLSPLCVVKVSDRLCVSVSEIQIGWVVKQRLSQARFGDMYLYHLLLKGSLNLQAWDPATCFFWYQTGQIKVENLLKFFHLSCPWELLNSSIKCLWAPPSDVQCILHYFNLLNTLVPISSWLDIHPFQYTYGEYDQYFCITPVFPQATYVS